ncbi:Chromodomain-helicase-DNA-binding protein 1-like protein [Triticum urartu]|uniref:Chromodomain-helicase-DNA-binding protein 1-like protein n=1 Tax=Triticum urartu TaxID=4572 RepID=M8B1Z8_TRIUA|nr:Chromodomain-helicase-DNA-binding protein 1-like protein [Triticum urartu]
MAATAYERRLLAAADLVLSADGKSQLPRLSSTDLGVTADLKPHQLDGVDWLIRRYHLGVNVLLVVLCPLSVTDGWLSEFGKFCPTLKVIQYVGDKPHRRQIRRTIHEDVQKSSHSDELPFDVMLTSYDIALMDQDFLSQVPWLYVVIDEAQRLKNPSSVLYNVLEERFMMPRRLLLTGTPVQNNLSELWALMHFCMPSVFGPLDEFLSTFKEAGNLLSGSEANKANRQFKILKHILRAFMLRRTKALLIESGILELPPLTELTVSVVQLRKACSHPYLFSGIEPEPYEEGEHLVQASGKLIVLDLVLEKLHRLGHRVVLFAQMTQTLDILQDFLELRNYTYERLDGSVRAEERFAAIRNFSSQPTKGVVRDDSNPSGAFVFMISTRAGGVGLNLIGADTVIFYEQDWNPQADKQALQRTHRIGQLNHVIMRRAERKLKLSHNIFGDKDATDGKGNDLGNEANDMRSIIFGLHQFDPADTAAETINEETLEKLKSMSENVIKMRTHEPSEKDDRAFEINPDLTEGSGLVITRACDSISIDPGVDEAAYLSWVEKFKEASHSIEDVPVELERQRPAPEDKLLKREANKKKAEEKRLAKWKDLGYQTLGVKVPDNIPNQNISNSGSVQLVYGDCTDPSKVCAAKPAIIFSCVDNSGTWGHGGMFDALTSLSTYIPDAYHRASEVDDLHMGDLHLIQPDGWFLC